MSNNNVINNIGGGDDGTAVAKPIGRLIFGLDATASREATWAIAVEAQARMFHDAAPLPQKLLVQLVYYRGDDECKAGKWKASGDELATVMRRIECEGGFTQIAKVLRHTLQEHQKTPVQALVFIGDACEAEGGDTIDVLAGFAAALGNAGVPVHMFQEGHDNAAMRAFRMIAAKSGGEYHQFNQATVAKQLGRTAALAITHNK